MRRLLLLLLIAILLCSSTYALNLDLQIKSQKAEFTDNESIILDVNVTNYDVFNESENTVLYVKIADQNRMDVLGVIKPDETKKLELNIGKLAAGTYNIESYLQYTFLDLNNSTQLKHNTVKVVPAKPIEMETYKATIEDISLSANIEINKPFTITVKIQNKADKLKIDYSFGEQQSSETRTEMGEITIEKQFTPQKEGLVSFSVTLYSIEVEQPLLEDSKSINLVVRNPANYEKVPVIDLKIEQGQVKFEAGKEPETNIIKEIGCFVVGGCYPDMNSPVVFIETDKSDAGYLFKISADDSKTGNSNVTSCFIRFGYREWILIEANYESAKVDLNYFTNNFAGNDVVQVQCRDAAGNLGVKTIGIQESAEVLIISKSVDSKLQKSLSDFAFAIKEDGLSAKIIDLADNKILEQYGLESGGLTDWKLLKGALAKFVAANKSKYVIFVGNEEEIPVPKIEINGTEIDSDVIYGFLEGDEKSFTKPSVVIARILGKYSDSQTSAEDIELLLAQFIQQHIDHSEDAKNKLTLRRIGRVLWNTAEVICANPHLKELTKDLSCVAATTITAGPGAASCPTLRLCVDGACFVIGNYDTLSKVADALQTPDPVLKNEKLNQLIKDGSLIMVAKDGLLLISQAADAGLIDPEISSTADDIYDVTTKAQKTLSLVNKIELSAEKLKNRRYGDIIQDAINEIRQTKNLDLKNLPIKDADAELLIFSMQLINGDPTQFVGGE